MPNENLENLVRIRELKREDPSAVEIEGLIGSALVRLKDAKNKDLALESRFDLAYNAAHALSQRHYGPLDIDRRNGISYFSAHNTRSVWSRSYGEYSSKRITRETSQNTRVTSMLAKSS